MGAHDRQESEIDIATAVTAALAARDRFKAIPELPKPLPGSRLAADDAQTAYDPMSALVISNAVRAQDCLNVFFEFVNPTADTLITTPFAHYSLLRTAIEASAVALWLVTNEKKNERIFRALRLSWRNAGESAEMVELLGGPAAEGERVRRRISELKDAIPALRQKDFGRFPRYSDILRSIAPPKRPSDTSAMFTPLILWKLASAFVHGSDHLVRRLSDVRQITEWSSGIASFEVTPSLRVQVAMAAVATDLLAMASDRYILLATTDAAGRSLLPPRTT